KARGKAPSKGGAKETAAPIAKAAPAPAKASQGHPKSPLAPRIFASLPPLAGVRLATGQAGVKYRDRNDVLMVVMAPGSQVAGVFTQSKTASAPVDWCRKQLPGGLGRVLVVNSGNANAFTGRAGVESVRHVAESASAAVGCRPQ